MIAFPKNDLTLGKTSERNKIENDRKQKTTQPVVFCWVVPLEESRPKVTEALALRGRPLTGLTTSTKEVKYE